VYAGHFAAGLALKGRVPEAPTWGLLLGVGMLDVLFGPFVLAGIERVSITPGVSPGFSLDYIDWSHSLVMSLVWSVLFALAFRGRGLKIAAVMGFAVFSHYLMDLPMHPGDMALWPGSAVHWGFGLWRLLPTGWWFLELAVIAVGLAYYWRRARIERSFGGRAWAVSLVVLILHLVNSPWLSAV
jgi:LexA-binding, inner membrane-associated putative hydrolase